MIDYDRSQGNAVIGGYVYRGDEYVALNGYYFFADYVSGRFWAWGGCGPTMTPLGKLLDGIIDADGFLGQTEVLAQTGIGHGGDAGGAVAGKVNGDAVGFLMVQRGKDSFT